MTATLAAPEEVAAAPETPTSARVVPEALRAWHDPNPRLGWLLALLMTAVGALTRFWALGFPGTKVFDEVYYTTEAQEMLRFGYEDNRDYMFIVHPPLGKWLIGFTELFHDGTAPQWLTNSVGWRLAPAIAGTVSVLLITRITRRMLHSNLFGAIAGLLLALEGLSVVLSRIAILDIFLQTFVLAGFGALVVDRDKMRARLASLITAGVDLSTGTPGLGPRPWRLVAGVMFGLACSVKWTAAFFFLAFVVLSQLWDRSALRAAGVRRPTRNLLRRSTLWAVGSLMLAPLATYLFTYLGWFTSENGWGRHWADTHSTVAHINFFGVKFPFWWGWVPGPIRSLGSYTLQAYRFHEGLSSFHPYRSNPWSWLVLGRPVDFYYDGSSHACGATTCSREILAIGTPLMWWAFVPMLLWLGWHWVTTRDWRAGAVWMAFLAGWVVWFQDLKRTMFFFYMAPLVPFMVIGLTLALGVMLGPALRRTGDVVRDHAALVRRGWGVGGVSVFLALVIADFVWMWPIFTGGLLTYSEWHARMWLPSWV